MKLRCRQCGNKIVQKGEDGSIKLRLGGALILKADGTCQGQCHYCKVPTTLPLTADTEAITKAFVDDRIPRTVERFIMAPKKQS